MSARAYARRPMYHDSTLLEGIGSNQPDTAFTRERLDMWHPALPSVHVFTPKDQSMWLGVARPSDSAIVPVMRDFKLTFYARVRGADGVLCPFFATRRAAAFDVAVGMLYDEYQDVHNPREV